MRDRFARIAGWCVERPIPVVAAVVLLAVIAGVAALRLEPDAGTDQLVDSDSSAYRATQDFKERFGDDAVVVLVKGDLDRLVLTSELGKLLSLEGCLSGNVEGGRVFTDEPAPEPCAAIADCAARAGRARAGPPSSTSRRSRRPTSSAIRREARSARRAPRVSRPRFGRVGRASTRCSSAPPPKPPRTRS